MTSKEYIEKHSNQKNAHSTTKGEKLVIDNDPSFYCLDCFEKNDELVKASHKMDPYGWECPHGHFRPAQKLAAGGVAYGPL